MDSEAQPISILFFPLLAAGHMIPMAYLARLFAAHGVKATILTTPANTPLIQPTIDGASISVVVIPFPATAVGLPDGCENLSSIPPDLKPNFRMALDMLRQPFDQVLTDLLPDCVVTDAYLPWTLDVATEHGIPRIAFDGTGFYSTCAIDALDRYSTLDKLPAEAKSLILPGLPHRIEMLRSQILDYRKSSPESAETFNKLKESVNASYGVVVNSFFELEPDYVRHYKEVIGQKAWHVGPVSLKAELEQSGRGNKSISIESEAILQWLDSKSHGSVVYVCFGTLSEFTEAQLREIALGLEASNHPFIWVVRKGGDDWLPEAYKERIEGRGLLIGGWAPQILILNHPAAGGFVTHCGWNSILEGVTAGKAMATWPVHSEQFYTERLVVDVLGIGVAVGVKEWVMRPEEGSVVVAAEVEMVVEKLMGSGVEAEERRVRVRELKEKAEVAVEEGGSSFVETENLIAELLLQGTKRAK